MTQGTPSPRFTETQIVEWLVDESRDVAGRITTVTTSGDRIFATGSTVIALAATVAIGGGKGYLLMWFPLAVSIVILHGLYLNNMVRNLIGYQIGLEKEILRRTGLPLVAWQSHVQEGGRSHRQVKVLLLTAVVVYAASAVIGLAQALTHGRTRRVGTRAGVALHRADRGECRRQCGPHRLLVPESARCDEGGGEQGRAGLRRCRLTGRGLMVVRRGGGSAGR